MYLLLSVIIIILGITVVYLSNKNVKLYSLMLKNNLAIIKILLDNE